MFSDLLRYGPRVAWFNARFNLAWHIMPPGPEKHMGYADAADS